MISSNFSRAIEPCPGFHCSGFHHIYMDNKRYMERVPAAVWVPLPQGVMVNTDEAM